MIFHDLAFVPGAYFVITIVLYHNASPKVISQRAKPTTTGPSFFRARLHVTVMENHQKFLRTALFSEKSVVSFPWLV